VSDGAIFAALFMSLTLLLVGVSCLFWPHAIQEYALKKSLKWGAKQNPFLGWMQTPQHVTYLRLMDAAVMSMAMVLTIVFMKKWFQTWFI
jgi:hypothetical protein